MTVAELIEKLEALGESAATVRIGDERHALLEKVELGTCYGCQRPEVTLR